MDKYADLNNRCIAIGSLPFDNVDDALSVIKQYSKEIPFCPQLKKYSANEDMLLQFLESMPAVSVDGAKIIVENDDSGSLVDDFNIIINDVSSKKIDKYRISKDYCVCFEPFIRFVETNKPKYAKTQITGPFTLSVNIIDSNGNKACFDEKVLDNITKTLALKALWQIKEIKRVSSETVPIVFIDEPTLSQLEKAEYTNISKKDMIDKIKLISDLIKKHGGISAIHCCGDCNWSNLLNLGFDLINFDAYTYANEMNIYAEDLKKFLENNGKIVWGIVPTLDINSLENIDIKILEEKLSEANQVLIKSGIDKNLIDNNLLISPSCGCATLSVELTKKTFKLANDLSEKLKG